MMGMKTRLWFLIITNLGTKHRLGGDFFFPLLLVPTFSVKKMWTIIQNYKLIVEVTQVQPLFAGSNGKGGGVTTMFSANIN